MNAATAIRNANNVNSRQRANNNDSGKTGIGEINSIVQGAVDSVNKAV